MSQHVVKYGKKVCARYMLRDNTKCINVGAFAVHTESITTEGEYFASALGSHIFGHPLFDANAFYKVVH